MVRYCPTQLHPGFQGMTRKSWGEGPLGEEVSRKNTKCTSLQIIEIMNWASPLPHTPNQVLIPTRCRSKLDY